MKDQDLAVVTGSFGYLGQYITREFLRHQSIRVRTLTGHPNRPNPFGNRLEVIPFHFDNPHKLVDDLRGATVVINTYWVRFNYGQSTFMRAVANVQNLIRASAEAGVRRFVHISITNPNADSPLGYFRGKAMMERTLIESGLSYAILRPTVLFGKEDILINNIAWLLRKLPIFGIFGNGQYRIQPVYVGDIAKLAVELLRKNESIICDAVGPETYTYTQLVLLIRERVESRAKIVHLPPKIGFLLSKPLNLLMRDIITTREEISGLMEGLLVSYGKPSCPTRFSKWSKEHAAELGVKYASELDRHYRKATASQSVMASTGDNPSARVLEKA